ncbi:FAD-dependent monooxygenase [Kitasatospora sp. NPDC003701]
MAVISNALVVGAGPAGLAAAVALRQRGIAVDVAELTRDRSVPGSELLLSSPALRALDSLGVADRVAATGAPISSARTYAPDGTLVADIELPRVTRPSLPPAVGIARRALHDALYDRAVALGAVIRHGRTVTTLVEGADGVVASLSDGTVTEYGLVVGADGVQSRVRSLILPQVQPEYTGEMVWRARIPRRGEAVLEGYAGPRNHAGYLTVSEDTAYVFCLVPDEDAVRLPGDRFPELLAEQLAGFTGSIGWARERLGGPESIHYAPIMSLLLPGPWHVGRVLLIGDAAHATPPHIGYGAGLAIEDGVVLAESLDGQATAEGGLKAFTERRAERCRTVVEAALTICRWQLGREPMGDYKGTLLRTWAALNEPV